MNRVILMGRLTADPETRYTPSNTSVSRFRLAVNRAGKQAEGQPTADFFDIVAWQKTADFVSKYFKKGMQVAVEGRLRNDSWTDKDNQKRFRTEVTADQVYFAEGRREGQGGDYAPAGGGYQRDGGNSGRSGYQGGNASGYAAPAANAADSGTGDGFYTPNDDDEDLPF